MENLKIANCKQCRTKNVEVVDLSPGQNYCICSKCANELYEEAVADSYISQEEEYAMYDI